LRRFPAHINDRDIDWKGTPEIKSLKKHDHKGFINQWVNPVSGKSELRRESPEPF
jgi:hypothetical protein